MRPNDTPRYCRACVFSGDTHCFNERFYKPDMVHGPQPRDMRTCRESDALCGREAAGFEAPTVLKWWEHRGLWLLALLVALMSWAVLR